MEVRAGNNEGKKFDGTVKSLLTCSVCGLEYDPVENPACGTCPFHQGCSMTCCPRCGASNTNVYQSRLVGLAKRLLLGGNRVSS